MHRTALATVAVLAALLATAPEARAQIVIPPGPQAFPGLPYATLYAGPSGTYMAPNAVGYAPPYSYFAAPPGMPARIYAGGYSNDFPYHGHPYGQPFDPWTWESLAAGPSGVLARYYYPPVR